ncbi:MAG: response regulator [Bacteroidetes bacterium]|nr:response regulator [Bacteroidota bacterium]
MSDQTQNTGKRTEEGRRILYRLLLLAVAVVYVLVFILDYLLQLHFTFFLLLSLFGFVIVTLTYMWFRVSSTDETDAINTINPQPEPLPVAAPINPIEANIFGDAVFMLSPVTGLTINCSDEAAKLFEGNPTQFIGADISSFFDPSFPAQERLKIKQGLDTEGFVRVNGVFRTLTQKSFNAVLEASKKQIGDRRVISVRFTKVEEPTVSASQVVTTAQQSEGFTWINDAAFPIAFIGTNYRFIRVNASFVNLIGYTESELLSLLVMDIIHPDDKANEKKLLSSVFRGEVPVSKREKRFLKRNNEVIWVSSSLSVSRDENGHPRFVISFVDNITQRKRIERNISESRNRLSSLVENTEYSMLSVDRRHTILTINARLTDMLYAQTGIVVEPGFSLLDILPDNLRADYSDLHARAFKGEQFLMEKAITMNGRRSDLEIVITPVKDEAGHVMSISIFGHDITRRRELEEKLIKEKNEAEAATQAKSGFLATMSHEIRTPLNGVIGMGRLLNQTTLNPKQQEFVDSILLSGEALLSVINDILDYSKIESSKMELENKPFAIKRAIEETYDLLSSKAIEKNLSLQYTIARDVPAYVYGDITRIRQIFMNLVSNAIKFTAKGKVSVKVLKVFQAGEEMELEFHIQDTGIGIPKSKIGRLFRSFSQADSSTAATYGGSGLGLAICKNLVELMHGTIHVESVEGQGSDFIFTIKTKAVPQAEIPKYSRTGTNRLANSYVMLISDDKTEADMYANYFKRWGMIPKIADDSKAAIEELKNRRDINLILIDAQMISAKASVLAREIRTLRSKDDLPIVLFNADKADDIFFDYTNEIISAVIPSNESRSKVLDILIGVFSVEHHQRTQNEQSIQQQKTEKKLGEEIPLRLLIAEDNQINQKLAQNIFEGLGYKPVMVSNGLQVIDALNKGEFDLIFMDVQMPEMDGLEATRFITTKMNLRSRPVIVAMTAFALEGDKEKCIEAGMDDYISKPFLVEEIIERIRKWGGRFLETQKEITEKNTAMNNTATELVNSVVINRLKEMTSGADPNFFSQVIQMFLDQSEEIVTEITSLLPIMDLPKMAGLAHKLKGSALNIGANKMAETCRVIEIKGKDLDSRGISDLVKTLAVELVLTRTELKNYL